MTAPSIQELYRDIATLPTDKLAELKQFVDFLRFTLKPANSSSQATNTLRFAGIWQSMSDQTFDGLMDDINERRSAGFKERRQRETRLD